VHDPCLHHFYDCARRFTPSACEIPARLRDGTMRGEGGVRGHLTFQSSCPTVNCGLLRRFAPRNDAENARSGPIRPAMTNEVSRTGCALSHSRDERSVSTERAANRGRCRSPVSHIARICRASCSRVIPVRLPILHRVAHPSSKASLRSETTSGSLHPIPLSDSVS